MISIAPSPRTLCAVLMLALLLTSTGAPSVQAASSKSSRTASLETTGWIPYWATDRGVADARDRIDQLTEVNPFGYSVRTDGTLADTANLGGSAWKSLFRDARAEGVKVVPTVMWSDTGSIYAVLSDPAKRAAHVQSIVSAITRGGFDGVDIDYEGKSAETRPGFAAFLSELSAALYKADKDLTLDCTIEARMPLAARYSGTPPANIEYANDLPTINKVCDRVRLMTYDQQTADLQLNAAHKKELYAPVSDTAWVEKVVNYMDDDIDRSKILIGVATYGAEYQAMSNVDGSGFTYTKTSAFNPQYALNVAKEYGITPSRNASGELYFSYVPKEQSSALPDNADLSKLAPKGTDSGNLAAAGALAYAKKKSRQAPVTFLTWSDADAIQDKAKLASRMGVAGIALFKIDGGEDPGTWDALASVSRPVRDPSTTRVTDNVTAPVPVVPAVPAVAATPTPVVTSVSFATDLEYGDESADVKRLQSVLIKKGYLKVAANGYFGPATKAAVTAWQKAAGLPTTGFFGPLSRAKIGS